MASVSRRICYESGHRAHASDGTEAESHVSMQTLGAPPHAPIGTFSTWPTKIWFGSLINCGLARAIRRNWPASP